jgi:hypothetical protein
MVAMTLATAEQVSTRRIFRLAFGVSLALTFSQTFNWPAAYLTGVLTLILLGVPGPAPNIKKGLGFVIVLLLPLCIGSLIFMPLFEFARWAGIILFILALFGCFYFSSSGGSPILGLLMVMGLSVIAVIGSVSIDVLLTMISSMALSAPASLLFVWLAHAFFPELPTEQKAPPQVPKPSQYQAIHFAMRSLVVLLPVTIYVLFSADSTALLPVMLKVLSMAQQANSSSSGKLGIEQIQSTLLGGLAAIIAWQFMSIWPSLILYGLIIAIAGLVFASKMFKGYAMHENADMWSYAFLTMVIILTPALADGQTADGASSAFYSRLVLFIFIGMYGWLAVTVFDAFFPFKQKSPDNKLAQS